MAASDAARAVASVASRATKLRSTEPTGPPYWAPTSRCREEPVARAASGAVAALELLAGPAGAEVVAADVLVFAVHLGRRGDGGRDAAARGEAGARGLAPGRAHRLRPGERLVLVAEPGCSRLGVGGKRPVLGGHLGVEEERD